jgi:hypothetical protein
MGLFSFVSRDHLFLLAVSGRRLLYYRISHARSAGILSRLDALGHWKET